MMSLGTVEKHTDIDFNTASKRSSIEELRLKTGEFLRLCPDDKENMSMQPRHYESVNIKIRGEMTADELEKS